MLYQKIAETIGEAEPILDIGCGEGKLANFLASTHNKKVYGRHYYEHKDLG